MSAVSALLVALVIALCVSTGSAQTAGDWLRVQSTDGELSIEVPTSHRVFFDADGFSVSEAGNDDLPLKNVYLLSAYIDGTLISLEVFDGSKAAKDKMYELDTFANDGKSVREFKRGQIKIKEITNRTEKYYSVRQFFNTKRHVCVLTAASRSGETDNMRRFLESLTFRSDSNNSSTSTAISDLKFTDVAVEFDDSPKPPGNPLAPKPTPEPGVKSFVLVRATKVSYTERARDSNVQGLVRIKLELGPDGFIPKLTIERSVSGSMLRQSVFAALRTKLLPREKLGIPVTANVWMEFGFNIR